MLLSWYHQQSDNASLSCLKDSNVKKREQEQWKRNCQMSLATLTGGLICEATFKNFQNYLAGNLGMCKLITQSQSINATMTLSKWKKLARVGVIWNLSLQHFLSPFVPHLAFVLCQQGNHYFFSMLKMNSSAICLMLEDDVSQLHLRRLRNSLMGLC